MRVLLVAGARPNFMKIAPLQRALAAAGEEPLLVHTGQHYDPQMSGAFFEDLAMPAPDFFLGAGSGSHAEQTGKVMIAFEPVLLAQRPDWVVVVGDVNSTLACALTTAKLRAQLGCRIAHVEAGLRSGDWTMPEEVNRVLTDRLSDLLLLPSRDASPNLRAEGIPAEREVFVGNVMIDTLFTRLEAARAMDLPARLGVPRGGYTLLTLHRPSNVDDRERLAAVLSALGQVATRTPVVFPVHPRTRQRIEEFGLGELASRFTLVDPLPYTAMLSLTDGAEVVLTDSGGLQEETTALGVPCVTLRAQTERPVTVTEGTNRMAPWPLSAEGILRSREEAVGVGRLGVGARAPAGWDGHAAERIVAALRTA
jgi:UDP-N-acetylglucosamine 2-epimerase (non-hydrolysing)